MPDNWFASRARVMVGLIEVISLYGSVCHSCGSLALLVSNALHLDSMVWFPAGFALPIGPLYLYFASNRVMEARLERWKRWKENGLIGARESEQLRREALAWYKARLGFHGRNPPIETTKPAPEVPAEPSVRANENIPSSE